MKAVSILIILLVTLLITVGYGQAGNLDPEFGGGDGKVITTVIDAKPSQGYATVVQPDGKIIVAGVTRVEGTDEFPVLARYMPDGSLDNSFNGTGILIVSTPDGHAYCQNLLLQPDGKIVIAVANYNDNGQKLNVFRFLDDGSPDNSFDTDGRSVFPLTSKYLGIKAMTLQLDGKILVGGYVGFENDTFDQFFVARLTVNGQPDNSFDQDGYSLKRIGESWTNIYAMTLQPDGKILACGYSVLNSFETFTVLRYTTNGQLDKTFSGDGVALAPFGNGDDGANGIGVLPDGKIIVGGYATSDITGHYAFAAARFTPDGNLDASYNGDGMNIIYTSPNSDAPRTVKLQPDGKLLLAGYIHLSSNTPQNFAIMRLNENGIPDNSFDDDGFAVYEYGPDFSGELFGIAFQPDGKIVCTGYSRTNGLNSIVVLRILSGLTTGMEEAFNRISTASIYPNPAVDHSTINYTLAAKDHISIMLCDFKGKVIDQLIPPSSPIEAGEQKTRLDFNQDLLPGLYLVKIISSTGIKTMKLVLCKSQ